MAKYRGGSGGEFVKFESIGDGVSGVVDSVSSEPNKFKGTVDTIINVRDADGKVWRVRCDKKALAGAAAKIIAEGGFRAGERIDVRYESSYKSKNFSNPGKDITIDLLDRSEGDAPATPAPAQTVAPTSAPAEDPEIEAAYQALVKAKGEATAKTIRDAVKNVAKGDKAQQIKLLSQAAVAA